MLEQLWRADSQGVRQYQVMANVVGLTCFALTVVLAGLALPLAGIVWTSFLVTLVASVGWQGVASCQERELFHQGRARHWLDRLEATEEDDAAQLKLLQAKGIPSSLGKIWVIALAAITVVGGLTFLMAGLAWLEA